MAEDMNLIVKFCEMFRMPGASVAHVVPVLYYGDGTVVEAQKRVVIDSDNPDVDGMTTVTVTLIANVAERGVRIDPQIQKRPGDRP